ncbi:MAG: tetratricopeptide repeat protein [Microscillaceae bacterium]|nr:tetratricopeptide repeat protein [Microscillaceae bacterium]
MRQILRTARHDTVRIDAWLGLASLHQAQVPDSLLYFAEQALKLSQKISHIDREASARHLYGQALHFKGEFQEAESHLKAALQLAQKAGNLSIQGKIWSTWGNNAYRLGDFKKALQYFLRALRVFEKLGDLSSQARLNNNVGSIQEQQENYEKALFHYFKALALKQKIGDKLTIGSTQGNIANVYAIQQRYDSAIFYYETAIASHEKVENLRGLASQYTNLGYMFWEQKKYSEALQAYKKSLVYDEKLQNPEGIAANWLNIASVYRETRDFEKAQEAHQKALAIYQKSKMRNQLQIALKSLARIQADMGHFDQAYQTLLDQQALKDSLFSEEKSLQMAEMQTRYETEKKEQENQLLRARNESQLRGLVALGALLALVLGIGLSILRIKQLQFRNAQAQIRQREQEAILLAESLMEKDHLVDEIQFQLQHLREARQEDKINQIEQLLNARISTENDWLRFRQLFESIYPNFFVKLHHQFPQLSPNEIKICAIEKLGIKDSEAGDLLGVNPETVKKGRYRLRKNLNEADKEALQSFIRNYSDS